MRKNYILLFAFNLIFTFTYAVQYHTISGGGNPNWSNTAGGANCNCSPQNWPANDTLVIHHSVNRNSNTTSWGNSGRIVIENGGVLNITGNNRITALGGNESFVIKSGGELSVGNNFSINLNSGNPYFEIEQGGIITAGNNFSITLNSGDFIGNGNLEANDLNITINNATGYMEVNGDWHVQGALDLTLWGSSTDETLQVNGLITSGSISGTNQTNITGTGAFIYDSGSINNSGALNGCTSCNTDSPVYLGGISPAGELTDITLWDGTSWSNGTPASNLNTVIFGEFTVNSALTAKSLAVGSGAALIIETGEYFEVAEHIDNNGTIHIKNRAALVQTGTATNTGDGTFIVEKAGFSSSANNFNVWSSPMPGQQITQVFDSANLYDIFVFDAENQQWKYDYGTLTPSNNTGQSFQFSHSDLINGADGIMNPGTGYFVPGNAVKPARIFQGNSVHNGNISVPVYAPGITTGSWTGTDWNLIGNPYPSGISVSDFIDQNTSIINNCVYLYNNSTGTYTSCNTQDSLALTVGQGFWVHATGNGNVDFTNTMRSGDASANLRSGTVTPPAVHLSLQTQQFQDPLRIYFTHQKGAFDAHKMANTNEINFYSIGQNQDRYVFQDVLPPNGHNNEIRVPLGVQFPRDTTLTVTFDRAVAMSDYEVYWVDHKLNTETQIEPHDEISFDYAPEDEERFELHIKAVTLNTEPLHAKSAEKPKTILIESGLQVVNPTSQKLKQARIFDISGKVLKTVQPIEAGDFLNVNFHPKGVFIVEYHLEDHTRTTQKLIVP